MIPNTLKWHKEPIQAGNKVQMYIYDDVSEYGEWDWNTWSYKESETSAKHFREALEEIPEGTEIELHINSNGGSVKEGVAIYNLLKQKENHKTGIVDGVAHSVAFLILQACDTRIMGLGTTALIHDMWIYCAGNAAQLRKYADDLDDMMEANRQIFLERATITEEELRNLMEKETYLSPEKALQYGLIDKAEGKRTIQETTEILEKELQELRQQLNADQSFREQIKKLRQWGNPEENKVKKFLEGMAQKGKE